MASSWSNANTHKKRLLVFKLPGSVMIVTVFKKLCYDFTNEVLPTQRKTQRIKTLNQRARISSSKRIINTSSDLGAVHPRSLAPPIRHLL